MTVVGLCISEKEDEKKTETLQILTTFVAIQV